MLIDTILLDKNLGPGDTEWLHLLMGDWQIIADTAHRDLLLWLPITPDEDRDFPGQRIYGLAQGSQLRSAGQVRPSTVHTVFHRDMVDQEMSPHLQERAWDAWMSHQVIRVRDEQSAPETSLNTTLIPLVRNGRTIALLSLHTAVFGTRKPPRVEVVYRKVADNLLQMVARGVWPEFTAPVGTARGNPRVGDGLITLDAEGKVEFVSPNVSSIYRRLGYEQKLEDHKLYEVTRSLIQPSDGKADETLPLVLTGRMPWRGEVKARRFSVTFRAIPLRRSTALGEERFGAVLLCRDVTELRRRELELMTKDATIREIHHRVKNNLQTVSALLRLQSRRMHSKEAKEGLEQAMRRVATIAMVHEALSQGLSQEVDFDDLIQRQFHIAAELASSNQNVMTVLEGSFGRMPSQFATPLALVINEVVANAVEHGLKDRDGTVRLAGARHYNDRGEPTLTVTVTDDGLGMGQQLGEGAGSQKQRQAEKKEGLGMQIVRTLVASELNGSINWEPVDPQGTRVTIRALLTGSKA